MSAPTPEPITSDVGWQGYLVGFIFAVMVLGGAAIATAVSYDNNTGSDSHAESGEGADESHAEEPADESHSEDEAEPADEEHDG